jgi:hypothetical protein
VARSVVAIHGWNARLDMDLGKHLEWHHPLLVLDTHEVGVPPLRMQPNIGVENRSMRVDQNTCMNKFAEQLFKDYTYRLMTGYGDIHRLVDRHDPSWRI